MTQKQKPKKQTKMTAAIKAALETKEMQSAPEHLSAVQKFEPIFEKLAQRSASLMFDVRKAVAQVIEFLNVPNTKEGHKKVMLVVKGCTQDGTVLQYARQWSAIELASRKGASLGTVEREDAETGQWAEVPCTAELIESRAELMGASVKAGESLNLKKRKTSKPKAEVTAATPDTVYDVLPRMIQDAEALARIKAIFNAAGYAIVTNLEATMIQKVVIPGTTPAKLRKAA